MPWAELAAGVMLVALIVYALSGGADFGGGIWTLLATGPRAKQQRELIDQAIAPIWEANHVWLILIVVLLFVCFPLAFSAASIALHIPLTLMLFGIVLRGAGFVFRHYAANRAMRRRWSRIFAASSAATPFFLGICLGAVTGERIVIEYDIPRFGFVGSWLYAFPMAVGVFAAALFALIAAVYLCSEPAEREVKDDFRARAIGAGVVVGVAAFGSMALAREAAPAFVESLLGSPWSIPLQVLTGAVALGLFAALWTRRYGLARALVIAQVVCILVGWGLAQFPMMIAPALPIASAAASLNVIRLTMIVLASGSVLLAPSFFFLYRVFKTARHA